jgi:hypothetical protein
MKPRITHGTTVRWTSGAAGTMAEKIGIVVEVVPAGKYPDRERFVSLYKGSGLGCYRDHESYVVAVKRKTSEKYYWPRVVALEVFTDQRFVYTPEVLEAARTIMCPTEIDYQAEYEKERDEAERLRVQLAGCMVAASDGRARVAAKEGDYGWSPAYADVLRLRREHDELRAALAPFMRHWNDGHYGFVTWNAKFEDVKALERAYERKKQ